MRPTLTANIGNLQDYIRSISSIPKFKPDAKKGGFPFITISRLTGAGGHSLAEAILKAMDSEGDHDLFGGWQILDQELCKKVVEDPKLKVSLESLLTEKFLKEMEDYLSQVMVGTSSQIAVFHKIAEIVRTCAGLGKVMIVGRAGSLLTKDLPLGTHVRLVAPHDSRVKTMMRQFNLTKDDAERQVHEQDHSRALLVKTYFSNKDINSPLLYDAVWNTDTVPIPSIAAFLVRLIKEKVESLKSFEPAMHVKLREFVQLYKL